MHAWEPALNVVDQHLPGLREALAGVLRTTASAERVAARIISGKTDTIPGVLNFNDDLPLEDALIDIGAEWGLLIASDTSLGTSDALRDAYDSQQIDINWQDVIVLGTLMAFIATQADLVTVESRKAVERIISDGLRAGLTPDEIAARIINAAGLTERQAVAVENYRRSLAQGGVPPPDVERMTAEYTEKLRTARADIIALHIGVWSANYAQDLVYQAFIRNADRVFVRSWITARDENVCPFCGPMEGQQAGVGQPFTLPDFSQVMWPPIHPRCRCTVDLVLR